jgi:hypothetical protein
MNNEFKESSLGPLYIALFLFIPAGITSQYLLFSPNPQLFMLYISFSKQRLKLENSSTLGDDIQKLSIIPAFKPSVQIISGCGKRICYKDQKDSCLVHNSASNINSKTDYPSPPFYEIQFIL